MMVLPTRSRVGAASRLRGYEAVLLANIHSRWIDELGNVAHHDLSSSRDLESTRCTLRISDSLANATAEPLPFESANLLANGVLPLASRVPAVDRAVRFPADRDEGVPESVHLAAEDRGLAVAGAAGPSTTWFPEDLDPGPIPVGSWLPYWQRRDEPRVHPASLCVRAEILAALGGWMAVSKKLRACPGLLRPQRGHHRALHRRTQPALSRLARPTTTGRVKEDERTAVLRLIGMQAEELLEGAGAPQQPHAREVEASEVRSGNRGCPRGCRAARTLRMRRPLSTTFAWIDGRPD